MVAEGARRPADKVAYEGGKIEKTGSAGAPVVRSRGHNLGDGVERYNAGRATECEHDAGLFVISRSACLVNLAGVKNLLL